MKKQLLYVSILILVVVSTGFMYWLFSNSRVITIHFDEVSSAEILDKDNNRLAEISTSGSDTRVFTTTELKIAYDGSDGYASGTHILADDENDVTLRPDFNDARKNQYFDEQKSSIEQSINTEFIGYNRYSVKDFDIADRGEWAYVLLEYNGDYGYSSDDLRTVLRLNEDSWSVVAAPNIVLTKYNSPDVDVDVLKRGNTLR